MWEKNCSSDWEKLLKFETEGQEFAKILRSLGQFIQTWKVRTIFGNRMLYKLVPGGLSDLNRDSETWKNVRKNVWFLTCWYVLKIKICVKYFLDNNPQN